MNDEKPGSSQNAKTTPPTDRKVRNPFDKSLIDRLHKPICSPGMCKVYKTKNKELFHWDIDQACALVPQEIVACNSQFEPTPDPALERVVEDATEKFFSQEMVIPSPLMSSKNCKLLQNSCNASVQISSIFEQRSVVTRDFSAQTVMTFPPVLPPEIEKMLETYCTFTQEQNLSGEYEITANGSLRRKLFFEEHSDVDHYDSEHTDDEVHTEKRPASSFEQHTPVVFSPDLVSRHYDSEHTDDEVHMEKRPASSFEQHTPVVFSPDLVSRHYDSEHTDDEVHTEKRPASSFEQHTPVVFSPDLSRDLVSKGMKRTFGTPIGKTATSKPGLRNKILDVVDFEPNFSPIPCGTPRKQDHGSVTSSSLASVSISPVNQAASSDEEKNNFTSPESDPMATCLECVDNDTNYQTTGSCYCKFTPHKLLLKRSASLKESPPRQKKSFSERRSLSMSSLNRSRSVQKLDFSMDMSIDGSIHDDHFHADSESSPPNVEVKSSWSIVEETHLRHQVSNTISNDMQSSTKYNILEETPTKAKTKGNVPHEISKIRSSLLMSPTRMSLDNSIEFENPLSLEDKKYDFNNVDLQLLTENITRFDYNNATKVDCSTSFKRVDSGFTENTFSSYYESAIKPSELTVAHPKSTDKTVLKEISNVNWMRVDSGFNENSGDSVQFFPVHDLKKNASMQFSETFAEGKENLMSSNEFDKIFAHSSNRNEAMSMSDILTDDMTFNCNFSSTPSKRKSRKCNS